MKVYLAHHAHAFSKEEDPQRHITPKGGEQSDRIGTRLKALGLKPARILHSDKQWTIDTAQRVGAKLGVPAVQTAYPVNTDDPIAPFIAEITASTADLMMCGHVDYLERAASQLVCGDEKRKVVNFKPGNGTLACFEGEGKNWALTFMWRQDHAPG